MQLHALGNPELLLMVCIGVLLMSMPSAAIAALIFRRSELALVIGSQVLTIAALVAWFGING